MVEEDPPTPLREGEVPPPPLLAEEQADQQDVGHSPAPSLDLDEHEELPTELSDSSETHDEGVEHTHTHTWLYTLLHTTDTH